VLNLPITIGGVQDPYTPSDGTWNVTGNVTVTGTVTAAAFTATGFTQGSVIFAGASGAQTEDNANFFWDDANNRLGIGTAAPAATLSIAQPVATSGAALALRLVGGAHTGQTASTEVLDIDLALNRTVTHATGALTTQRQIIVRQATHAFAAASTITNAYSLYVVGAPIAGTNATITNRWGTFLGGNTQIGGHIIPDTDGSYNIGVATTTRINNVYVFGAISWDQGNGATITSSQIAQKIGFNTYSVRGGSTGGSTAIDVIVGGASAIARIAGDLFQVVNNASGALTVAYDGFTRITNISQTSGTRPSFLVQGAAHTGQVAGTEIKHVHFDLAQTYTFEAGAISTQRAVRIDAPTYAFNGASVITNAATFYVSGAPAPGASATITNPFAVWIAGGSSRFDGVILAADGSAAAPGIAFTNESGSGLRRYAAGAIRVVVQGVDAAQFADGTMNTSSVVANAIYAGDISGAGATSLLAYYCGGNGAVAGHRFFASNSFAATSGATIADTHTYTFAPTSGTGTFAAVAVQSTINQTGGANGNYTALYISTTETAVGGTANKFIDCDIGGARKFSVDSAGLLGWVAGNEQTTVGAAGGASALPATPTKYLKIKDSGGTTLVVPAYAAA